LHVVLDSSTTTKHAKVQAWLASHPRIHPHFTPTDGWWLNLVEVVFSISERPALGGGDLASVGELVAAIGRFCDGPYQRCQPLTWTKDADQSFAKCKRPTALQAADGERPPAADGDGHAPPQAHSGRQAVPHHDRQLPKDGSAVKANQERSREQPPSGSQHAAVQQ
jgi:hypothetical protein